MGIQVLADEADKKRQEARERHRKFGLDRSALANADPNFRYRWTNTKPRAVQAAKAKGFEIVPTGDSCQAIHGVKGADGGQVLGEDLILMREPILDYEVKVELAAERMDAAVREANQKAAENIERMVKDAGYGKNRKNITEDNSVMGETTRGSR